MVKVIKLALFYRLLSEKLLVILIEKLYFYKCMNNTFDSPSSYLHALEQVVESDQGTSKLALIKSCVPQGLILGQSLFLIFLNDLPLI